MFCLTSLFYGGLRNLCIMFFRLQSYIYTHSDAQHYYFLYAMMRQPCNLLSYFSLTSASTHPLKAHPAQCYLRLNHFCKLKLFSTPRLLILQKQLYRSLHLMFIAICWCLITLWSAWRLITLMSVCPIQIIKTLSLCFC